MDLTRGATAAVACVAAAWLCAGCGADTPLEYSDDALILPATLQEALPLAQAQARAVSKDAYLTRMGGGYTVMDSTGRSANQTFVFHARVGPSSARRITVHLIHGSPWVYDLSIPSADLPPRFHDADLVLDSDGVVERVRQLAGGYVIRPAEAYAARLSVIPSWPEPTSVGQSADRVAWRVDVLVLQSVSADGPPVYFSAARFYFDPGTADLLGDPVIPETGAELYPFP